MEDEARIHLIGIGGIGMSGIANLLLDLGYEVSGSDIKESDIVTDLQQKGAKVSIGHQASNIEGADEVVLSSAIPEDNPELVKAKKEGLPILKRAEMVGKLMSKQQGISISGTHGKTTTTAMAATVLEKNSLDSTILVGGKLDLISGSNAKLGTGDYFITEADESDGSLLFMDPKIGVVTNIEADHLDYYESCSEIIDTFSKFLNSLPSDGVGIVSLDDNEIRDMVDRVDTDLITYGLNNKAEIMAKDIELQEFGSKSVIYRYQDRLGELKLNVPGKHNLSNALAVIGIGLHIGLEFSKIAEALKDFTGVKRRFEKLGKYRGAVLVDDYAHHPTELEATLAAANNMDFERIIAVFQPHRYTRTKFLLEEFSLAFGDADEVIITDIYASGEEPIPGVKAEKIAELINQRVFQKAKFIAELDKVYDYLKDRIGAGDLVLTLGAGDVWKVGDRLASNRVETIVNSPEELTMEV
ncbi:UDP-N-acetylmuramate--L-alanine ligase [Acetohalobium arabaticum]|uniref:UDP-N-acetylmuramate--L-alanine ligase n=1 Tax=Acetohalobium arabaticum (strain ATCC 49924 / DSM 5501 / Z-7288) TaxID=574087 RepID=D9QVM8_ACEAZ|nr:UDP-N-acetylmuramate--L-alanine ligase [Acetohalobium arabaticum]ADL12287.1 UDP-N-acetylmuramate/alanine ligase [Acetohalobium arabaticum DSM 5501]